MTYFDNIKNIEVEIPEDCSSCNIVIEPNKKGKAFICQHCKVKQGMAKEMTNGS